MKIYVVVGFDSGNRDKWDKVEASSRQDAVRQMYSRGWMRVMAVFSESEWDNAAKTVKRR